MTWTITASPPLPVIARMPQRRHNSGGQSGASTIEIFDTDGMTILYAANDDGSFVGYPTMRLK